MVSIHRRAAVIPPSANVSAMAFLSVASSASRFVIGLRRSLDRAVKDSEKAEDDWWRLNMTSFMVQVSVYL
jgi:hypothetical protein